MVRQAGQSPPQAKGEPSLAGRLLRLVEVATQDQASNHILVEGEGAGRHKLGRERGPASSDGPRKAYWEDVVVCDVVVELPAGATGESGDDVVDSSVVVVVDELGMELSSPAQPVSPDSPATANKERIRVFMKWMMKRNARLASDSF